MISKLSVSTFKRLLSAVFLLTLALSACGGKPALVESAATVSQPTEATSAPITLPTAIDLPPTAIASAPTDGSQPEICLTLEKWTQLVGQNDPLPSGLGGKLLTTVNEGDGANLPTISVGGLDGANLQRIDIGAWPSLSSDGSRLIYSAADGAHVVDLLSGKNLPLTIDGYKFIWSPDDTRIMYTDMTKLYVVNADGSGLQEIETGPAVVISPIDWLSDKQTIVYNIMSDARNGFALKSHNLQSGETKDFLAIHNKAGYVAISPDRQWIVSADSARGGPSYDIFISRIDGSERKSVTDSNVPAGFNSIWGPDGQWLIVNTQNGETPIPILVNPFTCQAVRLNNVKGVVEGWRLK
jgi:hypothetical protein